MAGPNEGAGDGAVDVSHAGTIEDAANISGLSFGDEGKEDDAVGDASDEPKGVNQPDEGEGGEKQPSEDAKDGENDPEEGKDTGEDGKKGDGDDKAGEGEDGKDEGDYLEIAPAEEGGEPQRISVEEVFEGYSRVPELESKIQELEGAARAMPEEVNKAIDENLELRTNLIQKLEEWTQLNAPQMPDPNMVNPDHPDYNPDQYNKLLQQYQVLTEAQESAKNELSAQQEELAKAEATRFGALREREMGELKKIWPELIDDKATRSEFSKGMQEHYGASQEELENIVDHRFFKLAKDALAFQAAQQANKKAVQVVRAKPKLVRGAKARPSSNRKTSLDVAMKALRDNPDSDAAATAALGQVFKD